MNWDENERGRDLAKSEFGNAETKTEKPLAEGEGGSGKPGMGKWAKY